jgi:hypothetical protein
MKTVLAVVGIICLLGIIVVGVGGYWVYKNSGKKIGEVSEKETEEFIRLYKPTEKAVNALHRIQNAAKLQDPLASIMLNSVALQTIEDKKVDDSEIALLDEGSAMGEKGKITKEQIQIYMRKVQEKYPHMGSHRSPN